MQRLRWNELIEKLKSTDIFETLKHAKNYFSASIATTAIGFISIPIFTRLFTQADYGIVAVFSAYAGIFTIILSLNSYAAVSRYYYEKTDDFGDFIGTTLILVCLIFGLSIPIFVLFNEQIAGLLQLPGLLPFYLIFVSLFSVISTIYGQILYPQKKSKELSILRMLNGYLGFGIAVLFVYSLTENRYLGQIWATLLVGLIFSIYYMIKIHSYSKFRFKTEHLKYIALFSLPLLPHALSAIILAQFDRIMINAIIDTASAGLYSFGYNVGLLMLMVIYSLTPAIEPDFYKFRDNKEYDRINALYEKVFSIVTIAALGLVLFAKEIVFILADEKFYPGLSVVPLVVIGYVFYGQSIVYGNYIGYKKKMAFVSIVSLTAGISNIVLNAIFIPSYGYIAAAYTTVASYFIMFLLGWIVAKFVLKERVVPLWIIWKPTLIMFCFIAFVYYLNMLSLNAILFFVIKLMVLALFGIIVFYKEIKIIAST